MSAQTVRRHFTLRHWLPPGEAAPPADPAWIRRRVDHYTTRAGLDPLVTICDPRRYQQLTGRTVTAQLWGDADYHQRLVYIAGQGATRGDVEIVVAHEIAHHRWPSYQHRPVFFDRCQQLLDLTVHRHIGSITPGLDPASTLCSGMVIEPVGCRRP